MPPEHEGGVNGKMDNEKQMEKAIGKGKSLMNAQILNKFKGNARLKTSVLPPSTSKQSSDRHLKISPT
jgi:hypothetical protein